MGEELDMKMLKVKGALSAVFWCLRAVRRAHGEIHRAWRVKISGEDSNMEVLKEKGKKFEGKRREKGYIGSWRR